MHFQAFPYEEAKLVRCTRGAMYDVIIDLRSLPRLSKSMSPWCSRLLTGKCSTCLRDLHTDFRL